MRGSGPKSPKDDFMWGETKVRNFCYGGTLCNFPGLLVWGVKCSHLKLAMRWLSCYFLSGAHGTHLRIGGSFKMGLRFYSTSGFVSSKPHSFTQQIQTEEFLYSRRYPVFSRAAYILVLPSQIAHFKTGGALMSNKAKMQNWCYNTKLLHFLLYPISQKPILAQ